MICIIDSGVGNICSVSKALDRLNHKHIISNKESDIINSELLILPGVGFFKEGMDNLKNLGIIDTIRSEVLIKKKPILGICLGMQLLFDSSEEGGFVTGLGLIEGKIIKFEFSGKNTKRDHDGIECDDCQKIPHVGWNNVGGKDFASIRILKGIPSGSDFYFVHSYHADIDKNNNALAFCTTDYGYDFVSVINKGNIYGVQFHPEKSQSVGLKILDNFARSKDA